MFSILMKKQGLQLYACKNILYIIIRNQQLRVAIWPHLECKKIPIVRAAGWNPSTIIYLHSSGWISKKYQVEWYPPCNRTSKLGIFKKWSAGRRPPNPQNDVRPSTALLIP